MSDSAGPGSTMPWWRLAGRAGVPPERVFMFNGSAASRTTFTANAGRSREARLAWPFRTVAMGKASLDEVRAVTGHEIGHYVLKHTWYGILFYSIAAIILFWLADRTFPWFARRFGSTAGLAEPRGVPVLLFMVLAARPAHPSDLQHVQPHAWKRRPTIIRFGPRNRPDALVDRAGEDRRSIAIRGQGQLEELVFLTIIPRSKPGPPGDGVEVRSSRAAHAIGEAFT
jgi:hypothetical protein